MSYLLITASICMLISLLLAWIASFIVYIKVKSLKRLFPATHHLIRAHIDYLLMTVLLVVTFFMCKEVDIILPMWVVVAACLGALYNPFGFILLAMKPELANPKTALDKGKILLGFVPATVGFGYAMVMVLMKI